MSDQYLSDKLRPLFKMVVWNAKPKDKQQRDKVFAAAMKHIEDAGEITDKEVVRVLQTYAKEFATLGLSYEAEKLENLITSTQGLMPNRYTAEGRELEWWEEPEFTNAIPSLPWELRASRVLPGSGGGPGGFLFVCFVLFIVLGIPYSLIIQPILKAMKIDDGISALLFLFFLPVGAWMIYRYRDSKLENKGRDSWCKLSEDGIEFHEPGNSGKIRWSEIKTVYSDSDSSPDEDSSYDVTEIVGQDKQKIRLSSQFYTDQEVRTVFGICMLRSR